MKEILQVFNMAISSKSSIFFFFPGFWASGLQNPICISASVHHLPASLWPAYSIHVTQL